MGLRSPKVTSLRKQLIRRRKKMEYVIRFTWDPEAKVWIAINDYIPLTLESESLDLLMKKVKAAIPELLILNNLPKLSMDMVFKKNDKSYPRIGACHGSRCGDDGRRNCS